MPVRGPADARRRGRGVGRAFVWLLVLGLVIAAVVIAVAGSSGGSNDVQVRPVDGGTTSEIVDQMIQLIEDNTR
jgi:hypothetical protein